MRRLLGFGLLLACSASPQPRLDGSLDASTDAPASDAAADAGMDAAGESADAAVDTGRLDGGVTVTLESYCERASEAWCRWLDRCGAGCASAGDDAGWCEAAMAAVGAGRLGYDPARGAACLEVLEAAVEDCADDGALAGCSPFTGRVPLGEPCYPSHLFGEDECADDGVCAGAADYVGFCPGRCVEGGRLGDPCDDVPCADGFRCFDTICLPLGDLGDACEEEPCRRELRCQPLAGALRCVAVRPIGDTCGADPSQRCVTGAACVAGRCVDAAPTGTACWDSAQCASSDWCDPSLGICAPRPGEGEACRGLCAAGTCVADGSSPTGRRCWLPAEVGEPCDPAPCADGLRCLEGTCAPPSTGACSSPGDCADGLWCDEGACRGPSPGGGPCGLCEPGLVCGGGRCARPLPNGAPCADDEACGAAADCVDLDGAGLRCRAREICDGP